MPVTGAARETVRPLTFGCGINLEEPAGVRQAALLGRAESDHKRPLSIRDPHFPARFRLPRGDFFAYEPTKNPDAEGTAPGHEGTSEARPVYRLS